MTHPIRDDAGTAVSAFSGDQLSNVWDDTLRVLGTIIDFNNEETITYSETTAEPAQAFTGSLSTQTINRSGLACLYRGTAGQISSPELYQIVVVPYDISAVGTELSDTVSWMKTKVGLS